MADPITDPPERLTPISYAVDDYELEVIIELMRDSSLATPASVIDLALYKLAQWYGIPIPTDAFDLARRLHRHRRTRTL